MKKIFIPRNRGKAIILKKNQPIRIYSTSIVDFVVFNLHNHKEKFSQAATKADQSKIFISKGDYLVSNFRRKMMKIVEDKFKEGHHDLQYPPCSKERYEKIASGEAKATYYKKGMKLPKHGCLENLFRALKNMGLKKEDIPDTFNIFQPMSINPKTGEMKHLFIKPKEGTFIELKAEMDLIAGISACPDPLRPSKKGVWVEIFGGSKNLIKV